MSRRKERGRDAVEFVIDIICTGRGQHPRTWLQQVEVWPDGSVSLKDALGTDENSHIVIPDDPAVLDAHVTHTFICRRCRSESGKPRTVELRYKTLERIALKLRDTHIKAIDVSALHAIL